MADYFESGSANSLGQLLGAFATFAQARGFTLAVGSGNGPSGEDIFYLTKFGMSFVWREDAAYKRLLGYMATGIDSGGVWGNGSVRCRYDTAVTLLNNDGPYTAYYFFSNAAGDYVHAVVEVSPGAFIQFSIGQINKFGSSWSGGSYLVGCSYDANKFSLPITSSFHIVPWYCGDINKVGGYIHRPVGDNGYGDFAVLGDVTDNQFAFGSTLGGIWDSLLANEPNALSFKAPLHRQLAFAYEITGNSYFPLGEIPGVRVLRIDHLSPKDIVLSKWQVFPVTQKYGDGISAPSSLGLGLAFEQVSD